VEIQGGVAGNRVGRAAIIDRIDMLFRNRYTSCMQRCIVARERSSYIAENGESEIFS
jgi:hypothetical protein